MKTIKSFMVIAAIAFSVASCSSSRTNTGTTGTDTSSGTPSMNNPSGTMDSSNSNMNTPATPPATDTMHLK